MGIINRTNDVSEQKESLMLKTGAQVNTNEFAVATVERPQVITAIQTVGFGVSGAPTGILRVTRFGGASYFVGSTFLVPNVGVSGPLGVSLPATGSSLLNLQKNDLVTVLFGGGTGAASQSAVVDIVVQNIADIKTWY